MAVLLIQWILIVISFSTLNARQNFTVNQRTCIIKARDPCCQANCTITKASNTLPTLNFHYTTNENFHSLHGDVHVVIKRQNRNPFTLISVKKLDMCQFIRGTKGFDVVRKVFKDVQKYGNIPKQCPVEKGYYFMENFVFNSDNIPDYSTNLTFTTQLKLYGRSNAGRERRILEVQYLGEIIRLGGQGHPTKLNG